MPRPDNKSAQPVDQVTLLNAIADYAMSFSVAREAAYETAYCCLVDALANGFAALKHPRCARLIGPIVPGATMPGGARVPGTSYELDPVHAAFNNVAMMDWAARERTAGSHTHRTPPSAALGGVMAIADYVSRRNAAEGKLPLTVKDVLAATIKQHEIRSALNAAGLEQSVALAIASSAVSAAMLGGTREQIVDAIVNAWSDAPVDLVVADVISRAVRHALLAIHHDRRARLSALTSAAHVTPVVAMKQWTGESLDGVVFSITMAADIHAHTAVEAGMTLHPLVIDHIARIESIVIETQAPVLGLVRSDALTSTFDRHACIRYMVATALVLGRLGADDYEDPIAADPRVELVRSKVLVRENTRFTEEYYAADKRYIGNAVQVFFGDGSATQRVAFDLPLGHRKRRDEGMPLLMRKFEGAVAAHFSAKQTEAIKVLFADRHRLEQITVNEFVSGIVKN